MFIVNIGRFERLLRVVIGLILLVVGYMVFGIYAYIAYFFGIIMLVTGIFGWCGFYSFAGFSSKGKGFDKVPKSEVERVLRESRVSPSVLVEVETQKNIVEVLPASSQTIKKNSSAKKTKMATKKTIIKPVKKVVKATTSKSVAKKNVPAKKATTSKSVAKKAPAKKTK